MKENYHLMRSDNTETDICEEFVASLPPADQMQPGGELLELIYMIHTRIRLDIGIRPDCAKCRQLAGNALAIAAYSPYIQVHLLNLSKLSQTCKCYGSSCVPFVLVNGRYPYFGNRSMQKLVWIIAEVIGREMA